MHQTLIMFRKFSPAFSGILAVMLMASQISMAHAMAGMQHTDDGAAVSHMSETSAHADHMQDMAIADVAGSHDENTNQNDHQSGHCATLCMSALMPSAPHANEPSSDVVQYSGLSSTGFGQNTAGLKRPPRT